MKNLGKIIFGIVAVVFILTIGWVLSSIFSNSGNVDMFIMWLIFAASDVKAIFQGGWSTAFIWLGIISLVVYFIYFIIRAFGAEGKEIGEDDIGLPEINDRNKDWDKSDERKFKKWGLPFRGYGIMFLAIAFAMHFLAAGIPNAKQAAVIYIVPKIINNADMREIPPNLDKLVNEGLKDMIEGIKDDTKGALNEVKEGVKDAVSDTIQEGAEKVKEKIKGEGEKQ